LMSTRVTDEGLAALAELTDLRELNVAHTLASERGCNRLRSQLTNAKIVSP